MRNTIKHKIQSNRGETLAETLCSMLIVVLAFLVLAGGIVAAAKVNAKARDLNLEYRLSDPAPKEETVTVEIVRGTNTQSVSSSKIKGYHTGRMEDGVAVYDGYYYYEYTK